jgi:hypothetical protein
LYLYFCAKGASQKVVGDKKTNPLVLTEFFLLSSVKPRGWGLNVNREDNQLPLRTWYRLSVFHCDNSQEVR